MMNVMGITGRPYGGGDMGMQSEGIAGTMMSRGMASFGPMMMGGAAMLGLDPMGLGIRAGMGVLGSGGGLMSAGMAGMGAFGLAGAGVAGAGYLGQQVMQGANNSMALNNALRQNFNFMNGQGGQGFNRADMTNIGGTLQSMTHQFGPGGEVTGFSELSRLASNMGRMGLTTGVRDAQEFTKRFKEMVSTLKTVATELGTSLEAAQELISSSRGSGIFKRADQLRYSGTIRNLGLAGNLATSELTAMGSIGSQVTRQYGGLGRQGAFAGMKALGQVGTATQMGALSEEDIYNATGLTGAEGRQAMATEMLESSGKFMRSAKGRYFLASVAGKDGSLNMDAVNEYLSGGMGVGRTRELAQKNLSGMGRANFIRNEGRLRGAAMEQFGGMAPALALMGWAQERGIDINDMDDRSMLFAQRHLGMGRDELDATVKMAQNLPDIMRKQRDVASDDRFNQARAQHVKSHSVQVRLDQIREKIQGGIQQWGSNLFNEGSEMLDGMLHKMLDVYEQKTSSDLNDVMRNAKVGGASANKAFNAMFGIGSDHARGEAAIRRFGLREAGGYKADDAGQVGEYIRNRQVAEIAARAPITDAMKAYITDHGRELARTYAENLTGKHGRERVEAFGQMLERQAAAAEAASPIGPRKAGDARTLLEQFRKGNAEAIVGGVERGIGLNENVQLAKTYDTGSIFKGAGGYQDIAGLNRAIGRAYTGQTGIDAISRMVGNGRSLPELSMNTVGLGLASSVGQFAGTAMFGIALAGTWDYKTSEKTSQRVHNYFMDKAVSFAGEHSGDSARQKAVGDLVGSDYGRKLMVEVMSGNPGAAYDQISAMQAQKYEDMSPQEQARLGGLQQLTLGAEYARATENGKKLTAEQEKSFVDRANGMKAIRDNMGGEVGIGNIARWADANVAALALKQEDDANAAAKKYAEEGLYQRSAMSELGILDATGGFLSEKTAKDLGKIQGGSQAAKLAQEILNEQIGVGELTGEARERALSNIKDKQNQMYDVIGGMSVADKRAFAKKFSGSFAGQAALDTLGTEQRFEGLRKGSKGSSNLAVAKYLGLDMSKEDSDVLKGKSPEEMEKYIKLKGHLTEEQSKDLHKAFESVSGKKGDVGLNLQRVLQSLSGEQKKGLGVKEGEKDPNEDIAKNTAEANQYLKALVASNQDARKFLSEMNAKAAESKNNPETKKG